MSLFTKFHHKNEKPKRACNSKNLRHLNAFLAYHMLPVRWDATLSFKMKRKYFRTSNIRLEELDVCREWTYTNIWCGSYRSPFRTPCEHFEVHISIDTLQSLHWSINSCIRVHVDSLPPLRKLSFEDPQRPAKTAKTYKYYTANGEEVVLQWHSSSKRKWIVIPDLKRNLLENYWSYTL